MMSTKNNLYQIVFDAIDDAIFLLEEERIIQHNAGALTLFDCQAELIAERTLVDLSAPKQSHGQTAGQLLETKCRAALAGIPQTFDWLARRPNGEIFNAAMTLKPLHFDDRLLLQAVIQETTHQQDRLRQLYRAVEQSANTIVITDTDGIIEYVNPKFSETTGYTAEEAIGQHTRILKSGHTSSEEYRQLWLEIKAGREWRGEFHNRRKNGELYWELASISPIKDEQGQITHFLAVKEDITARKAVEAELAGLLETQARQVQLLTEISQDIATSPTTYDLFPRVVDLVQKRFGFYHVQIYQLQGQNLVLEAGTGQPGREMKANGHQIALAATQSLVARAARTNQPVLVADTAQEPDWLPNALLPDTRSEIALPISMIDQMLGVLDVQSDRPDGLTDADQTMLLGLCGQIAIALQNAQLVERKETSLREVGESQQMLKTIIDATPDWILIKDRQHRYQMVNRGYANSMGIEPEAFIGKDDLELGFPEEIVKGNPEKGIQGFWPDDDEVMTSGQTKIIDVEPAEIDGRQMYLSTIKIPLRNEAGDVWGVLAYVRDITERENLLTETDSQARRLAELNTMTAEFNRATALDEVYKIVTQRTRAILGVERVSMALISDTGEDLEILALDGVKGTIPTGAILPVNGTRLGQVIKDRQMSFVPDMASDAFIDSQKLAEQGVRSALIAPLVVGGKVIGTLNVGSQKVNAYSEQDQSLFQQITSVLASTIESRQLLAQTEQALQEVSRSQEFLRTLIDNVPNPIFFKDAKGAYQGFNQAFLEYIGKSDGELLGKTVYDLGTKKELADRYHEMDMVLIREPGSQVYEAQVKYADGSLHDVIFNKRTYLDATGKPAGLVGTMVDITARKQDELELRRLNVAVEQSLDGLALADLDGNIEFINPAWARMHGYTADSLIGKHLGIFHTEEQLRTEVKPFNEQVFAKGSYQAEIGHCRKDGTAFPTWMSVVVVRDESGQPTGLLAAVQDITERKEAEEESKRLSRIIETTSDCVAMADAEGRALYLNQAGRIMLGFGIEEDITTTRIPDYHPAWIAPFVMEQALPVAIQDGIWSGESAFRHRDGREIPVLQVLIAQKSPHGEVEYFATIARDISDRKETEAALAKQATELETVAQVSSAVATVRDVTQLLQEVCNLSKEQFHFYHVHIYLLNKENDMLDLAAGAGEVGRQMVGQGWHIPLERESSLVARAARERQGVIVNDVHDDPYFLPNRLLPDTRSEMAIPMLVGEQLLGVLDVQSEQVGRFNAEDVRIKTALAGQVAIALDNARLLEQTNASLAEVQRLATIVENQPDFIGVTDLEGNLSYINPAGLQMMGLSPKHDISAMTIIDFFPPAEAEIFVQEGVPTARKEGIWQHESRLLKSNGTAIPVEQTIIANYDPHRRPQNFNIVLRDITDRRAAEVALRQSEAQLNEALQAARLSYWELDYETMILTLNDQAYALLGTTVEVEGGYQLTLEQYAQRFVHPDDRARIADEARKAQGTVDPNYVSQFDHAVIRADGEGAFFRIDLRIVKDEAGRTVRAFGTYMDITRQKQAELEREQLLAEVEATVRRYVAEEWDNFLSQYHHGHWQIEHQILGATLPQSAEVLNEVCDEVLHTGQAKTVSGLRDNGHSRATAMVVPIRLRGQTIGTLTIEDGDTDRLWMENEITLVEAVSEQLALTVENLRLFDSTQQRAAREQLTLEITDKMRSAPDLETIIETGLTELASALGVARTYVKLTPKSA